MAQKEGKNADEEYEFQMPDFDEDGFIHKEMVSFRTTSILFVAGILAALASWGIFEYLGGAKLAWFIGLAIVAVLAYALRYIYPALKVDIKHFGRREWFGTVFLLFFAWLAFFILFVNPPISDHADPTADVFLAPSFQVAGGDVELDFFVADNFRIDDHAFTVLGAGETVLSNADLTEVEPGHFEATLSGLAKGSYTYVAQATDGKGNTNTTTGTFVVGDIVTVNLPSDGTLDGTDTILVTVDNKIPCNAEQQFLGGDCLRTVFLALADGTDIHLEYDPTFGGYKATANFKGWSVGNNQFDVVVEQSNQFYGHHIIEGGMVVIDECNGNPCSVNMLSNGGQYETSVIPEVTVPPVTVRTPGFGLLAGILVLVGATFVARRRQ